MHSSKPASRLCDALILSSCCFYLAASVDIGRISFILYGYLSFHTVSFSNVQFFSNFFFRFSQQFIDVRENERKRSQRGLVSVPSKYTKLDDDKSNAQNETATNVNGTNTPSSSSSTTTTAHTQRPEIGSPGFKPEHLLELQEKITKEILSTKLGENEMHELQVKIHSLHFYV